MDRNFKLHSNEEARALFGNHDEYLKIIEREYGVKIVARGDNLTIIGEDEKVGVA